MSITFYPTVSRDEVNRYCNVSRILLVASSFAAEEVRKHGKVRKSLPQPRLSESVVERAADCGGFVSTFKWRSYRYSPEQYVEWLYGWQPQWAATMDYCCEDEITSGQPGIVRKRQYQTTDMAHYFWTSFRDVPWVWVPTIQGWEVKDYKRHAREMRPLIEEMHAHYGTESAFRVGIGTLCRRASVQMIHEVVNTVARELPGLPLHLWGIKLGALQAPVALPACVTSVDSAAWDGLFFRGNEAWRTSGMTRREWSYLVALPRYEAKVERALSIPKQATLF